MCDSGAVLEHQQGNDSLVRIDYNPSHALPWRVYCGCVGHYFRMLREAVAFCAGNSSHGDLQTFEFTAAAMAKAAEELKRPGV